MKWVVITLASRAPKEREHNRIAHFGRLLKLEIAVQLRNEGEEFQALLWQREFISPCRR